MKKNSSLASFKDVQKQNCQANLAAELQRLLMLCPVAQREGMEQEFSRFQNLFDRYLKESGDKIDWEKINPPPKDRVSCCCLSSVFLCWHDEMS